MTVRVEVRPSMLAWAVERSRRDVGELLARFPALPAWEQGTRAPTLRQLEEFARATRTPFGYLLLDEPPPEPLPVPDFRTVRDEDVAHPSPDLLDTIALCEERQDWYTAHARAAGQPTLGFVGSLSTAVPVPQAADRIREFVGFGLDERRALQSWTDALRSFVVSIEGSGVLVMVSGIVGSNTHRVLDPREFRGFVLIDDLAPLIFVNGADAKAAQIFTLAHELAHVWLGQSALDDPRLGERPDERTERWCNEVAAEVLLPAASLRAEYDASQTLAADVERLARRYRVSGMVVLHALLDTGLIRWDAFSAAYAEQVARIAAAGGGKGGDFYRSQPVRVSRRFARAVVASAVEGTTLYRDAYRLLGFRKHETFEQLRDHLGIG